MKIKLHFALPVLILTLLLSLTSCTLISISTVESMPDVLHPDTTKMVMDNHKDTPMSEITEEEAFPHVAGKYDGVRAAKRTIAPGNHIPSAMMYHLIMEEPYNTNTALFVRPGDFAAELDKMNERGCTYLFADEYQNTADSSVILTFDDGYEDNYTTMFPILVQKNARATVFLATSLIGTPGYLTEDQIKEMADSGYVRFGSHTVSHVSLDKVQGEDKLRYEFSQSKKYIEDLTGIPVHSMAYPSGKYNKTVLNIVKDYFDYCYTTKSPRSYPTPDKHEISRYYMGRDLGIGTFVGFLH